MIWSVSRIAALRVMSVGGLHIEESGRITVIAVRREHPSVVPDRGLTLDHRHNRASWLRTSNSAVSRLIMPM
jgi:hypothetical protein